MLACQVLLEVKERQVLKAFKVIKDQLETRDKQVLKVQLVLKAQLEYLDQQDNHLHLGLLEFKDHQAILVWQVRRDLQVHPALHPEEIRGIQVHLDFRELLVQQVLLVHLVHLDLQDNRVLLVQLDQKGH